MTRKQTLAAQVSAARAAVIAANSAVASMARAANATNPERMLRCWTAQCRAELISRRPK